MGKIRGIYSGSETTHAIAAVVEVARQAAQESGAAQVTVFDSRQLSLGMGFQVQRAARAALGSAPGAPYEPARAQADLAALEALPDVAAVSLETAQTPEGVVLSFRIVPVQRLMPPQARESAATRVADVQVRGNRRIESAAILARVSHKRGAPLVPAQLSEDIRQVYALGFFREVQAAPPWRRSSR